MAANVQSGGVKLAAEKIDAMQHRPSDRVAMMHNLLKLTNRLMAPFPPTSPIATRSA
jgi:hypothetical protein